MLASGNVAGRLMTELRRTCSVSRMHGPACVLQWQAPNVSMMRNDIGMQLKGHGIIDVVDQGTSSVVNEEAL
jgi:hypothetical protein